MWLRWTDARTIDNLTGQLKAQKQISEQLKEKVRKADEAVADIEAEAKLVSDRERTVRAGLEREIRNSKTESDRLRAIAAEARTTYRTLAESIPHMNDISLAQQADDALTEVSGRPEVIIRPSSEGFALNRSALEAAMGAAVEAIYLRGEVGNLDAQVTLASQRETALTAMVDSTTKELKAANDSRDALLVGIATMREYERSLEAQLKTVAERDKVRSRRSLWTALTPKLGVGIAAGMDMYGKPNVLVGATFGWTF
jgi:hypothetical protein